MLAAFMVFLLGVAYADWGTSTSPGAPPDCKYMQSGTDSGAGSNILG